MVVPLDTRQPWWPLVAAGAAGGVWRKGRPMRVKAAARDGLLKGPGGVDVPEGCPLLAIRLDFRRVTASSVTTPGLRRRLQSQLAFRMRGA